MRWFSSWNPVARTAAAAALGVLLTTGTASAAGDDSNNSDSTKTSSDNDRSSSHDDNDRSDQGNRNAGSQQSPQGASSTQAGRQTSHPTLGVTFYNNQSAPLEIRRVTPGSPADHAGLERGDEILSVDGRRVANLQQLREQIDRAGSNEDVEFGILRDDRHTTVTARLTASRPAGANSSNRQQAQNRPQQSEQYSTRQYGEQQAQNQRGSEYERGYWAGYQRGQQQFAREGYSQRGGPGSGNYARSSRTAENGREDMDSRSENQAFLGVTLDENNRDAARVTGIYPNSPAAKAGLRPHDDIVSIDGQEVKSTRDVRRLLGQKDADDDVAIEIRRAGRERTLHATLVSHKEFRSSYDERRHRVPGSETPDRGPDPYATDTLPPDMGDYETAGVRSGSPLIMGGTTYGNNYWRADRKIIGY